MLTEYHLCEIYVVFFFHADVGIFFVITVEQQSEIFTLLVLVWSQSKKRVWLCKSSQDKDGKNLCG